MRFLVVALFLVVLHRHGEGSPPSILLTCSRDDPDLNDCLKDAIQKGLKALAGGYNKQGFKIPALDPFINNQIVMEYKHNQIYGKAIVSNVKAFGLSKAKVHNVRADLLDDRLEIEVDMSNEQVFVEGHVDIGGQFNAIYLPGAKGFFNNTMRDLTWTWKIRGLPEARKNQTYMTVTSFSMRPKVGHMYNHLPILFPDNPALNRIAVDFANAYWKPIYQELLPLVERAWGDYGVNYANKIFKKVPYDELFPLL